MRRLSKTVLVLSIAGIVSACGGGGSSTNRAPQLGAIADQQISANVASDAIPVTVTDRGIVRVSAASDNQTVIADSGIAVSGSGADFTLVVTPVAGALGSATLTVTATDRGGLTDQTQFQVTVNQQQVSFSSFARDTFADDANDTPRDINSRTFDADALNDDFSDLLN